MPDAFIDSTPGFRLSDHEGRRINIPIARERNFCTIGQHNHSANYTPEEAGFFYGPSWAYSGPRNPPAVTLVAAELGELPPICAGFLEARRRCARN